MKRRTWLIDALRLHFDEHLSRIEAGRRLGIPKSTVCDLFIRFRRHDLTWPVPGSMTCRKLEKILYPQRLSVSSLAPEIVAPVPAETFPSGKLRRRPNFPREFKIALVERSLQPDVSVALLARENGINANLLFNWRHLYRKGLLVATTDTAAILPVVVSETSNVIVAEHSPPVQLSPSGEGYCCELVLPAGTLKISGALTPALLRMLITEMKGTLL